MPVMEIDVTTRRAGTCRGCGARIVWVQTAAGRWMPMNGNAPIPDVPRASIDTQHAHWASCPAASQFKRGER